MTTVLEAPAGLENVVVARTTIGDVHGGEGFYHYRGHDAAALARTATVEDAWHLLHCGDLPARPEFVERVRAMREIPTAAMPAVAAIARASAPGSLHALAGGVLACGASLAMGSWLEQSAGETERQSLAIPAMLPVVAAVMWRISRGLDPVDADPALGHAANLLHMVTGERPDHGRAQALERYMALTLEHGFNNSTFAARVICSSGADLAVTTAGAIGALSGPLHGGAPARVRDMLAAIARHGSPRAWVEAALQRGERIPGFGHRAYRSVDPRSEILHDSASRLDPERTAFAEEVERTVLEVLAERKPGRELPTNVEFYAGVVLELAGLPAELFVSAFACSRCIGWMANVREQMQGNRIFRPVARYVGPDTPRA